jgi:hypothetical protein
MIGQRLQRRVCFGLVVQQTFTFAKNRAMKLQQSEE